MGRCLYVTQLPGSVENLISQSVNSVASDLGLLCVRYKKISILNDNTKKAVQTTLK